MEEHQDEGQSSTPTGVQRSDGPFSENDTQDCSSEPEGSNGPEGATAANKTLCAEVAIEGNLPSRSISRGLVGTQARDSGEMIITKLTKNT
jgi:hypothetical protein